MQLTRVDGPPSDAFLKPWKGDFDAMLEKRLVRVLAPYSRTFYFNELGRERGYAADLVRVVEKYLNKTLAKQLGNRPLTFILVPTTRDRLITGVAEGLDDIAVNLGVTEERKKLVDFIVAPDATPLAEVVLTGPKSPVINSVEDLAGRTVHTRPSSTYHESLVALNERFKKAGKPLVTIVSVPDALEDEDMMEMLNLGLFEVIVVDDLVANMWAKVNSGRVRQLQNPTGSADYKRFEDTLALFTKYAT